jgi:hypothetical protein
MTLFLVIGQMSSQVAHSGTYLAVRELIVVA